MMGRFEHLQWFKGRALKLVDSNDMGQAFSSMLSDLRKHPETDDHVGIQLGMGLLMAGKLISQNEMRKFIEGFN